MAPLDPPFRRFLNELRRRRVPQTTAVYLVVAFGVLEAADLVLPRLGLPDWTVTLVLALLLLGLPLVVFLAWSFDLTRGGVERTNDASSAGAGHDPDPDPAAAGARGAPLARVDPRWVAAVAAVVLVAGLGGAWAVLGAGGGGEPLQDGLVVVPPFRVSGDAAYLEEGMVDLLAAKLTGEGGLRAVEPRAVLAAWNRSGPPEDAAKVVARELGAGKVLLGSVVATGSRLILAGRVHKTDDFAELARHEVEGPADSLPALVDRFLTGLLAQVAGVDNSRMPTLERTPLAALRAYLEGHTELRAGRFAVARDAFQRAISTDTTFAQAGVFHTIAAGFTVEPTSAGMRLAWRHQDRLAPRDRAVVEAYLGPAYPEWSSRQQVIEARRAMTRIAPDRAEGWYIYGDYVYHSDTARPLAERIDQAERAFQQAIDLDPSFAPASVHVLSLPLHRGDTTTVREQARAFLADHPDGELATIARGLLDVLDGPGFVPPDDSAGFNYFHMATPALVATSTGMGVDAAAAAAEWAERNVSDAETLGLWEIARFRMEMGQPRRALELLASRGAIDEAEAAVLRVYGALYWDTGESPEALEPVVSELEGLVESLASSDAATSSEAACVAGQFRTAVGAWSEARRWADVLDGRAATETGSAARYARACAAIIGALVAIEMGTDASVEDAVGRLDRAHATGLASDPKLRDAATLVLARGFERLGELERALDATHRRVIEVPSIYFRSTQLREEGRIAAALGRTDEAVEAYRHYVALRPDPEPAAVPFVEQVEEALARLTADR